ncbi:alpha/beta hydrolase family protein [Tenacibaculum retecalamus]|uniref:alpha/beta hydrolase family protein n=1 Tax=Tenacibaculum retecalamus TaxID=3018315 RepID=UPI0023D965C6|nr:alpha/beta fold hydrolase [Tenacibaculum retecalamus]WBX70899.1 alpha/beta hydrolase fold domain-containing protein [Tenacibaculum retecalamus]
MEIKKNIILDRVDKKPILIDVFSSKEKSNQTIVIFCHGYKGFKDWGAWNLMAEYFANAGFCFVKFNFSHNGGTIENPIDFPDLEAFGNNNYTKELDDLNDVLDWVSSYFKESENVNTSTISVIGHSRGGGISIIKASEDARITKLVTLASVSDLAKRTATVGDLKEWKESGVKYVVNGRTKQQMPHYYQFYKDFKANETRLNIKSAEEKLKIPHLIIHGDNDTSISINEAKELNKWNINSKLQVIEGADHVFNVKHPWDETQLSAELEKAVKIILIFLK